MRTNLINNSIAFGKTALMKCSVVKADTKEKQDATLYLMDSDKKADRDLMRKFSKNSDVCKDFLGFHCSRPMAGKFYVLTDDKTGELISAARSVRRFATKKSKIEGSTYTSIINADENRKYLDSIVPTVAQIAKDAYEGYDAAIVTSYRAEDGPFLKKAGFSENKYGGWTMPEKRFSDFIDRSEKRNGIEYLV